MKKVMLSVLAVAFAATAVMANGTPVKKNNAKQEKCTKCTKAEQATKKCKKTCDKKDACCK